MDAISALTPWLGNIFSINQEKSASTEGTSSFLMPQINNVNDAMRALQDWISGSSAPFLQKRTTAHPKERSIEQLSKEQEAQFSRTVIYLSNKAALVILHRLLAREKKNLTKKLVPSRVEVVEEDSEKDSKKTTIAARSNSTGNVSNKKPAAALTVYRNRGAQKPQFFRINITLSDQAILAIARQIFAEANNNSTKKPLQLIRQSRYVEVIEGNPEQVIVETTPTAATAPMSPSLQKEAAAPAQEEAAAPAPAQEKDLVPTPKKVETTQVKRGEARVSNTAKPGKMRILLSKIADLFKKLFLFITYPFRAIYTRLTSRVT
ncbi:hypothetical protein JYU14_04885 [Simkania negevensis]|uniref:Uncharacterized protein n=1 Tax=Simkania negevensis TaxID=83561 RepID=A0ABS3ASR8_9BACT|nr:hypothetical protein [Simkania negevensis]